MADGLAALAVDDRQRPLVDWIERMPPAERAELRPEVDRQADGLRRRWPRLEPSWLPRTQVAMRARLAGGPSSCRPGSTWPSAGPPTDEASVAIVEVKSGMRRRMQHRLDLHFYALIETLRSPAPPFVVATYYTRTGELDVEPVTEELLTAAARRALAGTCSHEGVSTGGRRCRPRAGCAAGAPAVPGWGIGQAGRPGEGGPT